MGVLIFLPLLLLSPEVSVAFMLVYSCLFNVSGNASSPLKVHALPEEQLQKGTGRTGIRHSSGQGQSGKATGQMLH